MLRMYIKNVETLLSSKKYSKYTMFNKAILFQKVLFMLPICTWTTDNWYHLKLKQKIIELTINIATKRLYHLFFTRTHPDRSITIRIQIVFIFCVRNILLKKKKKNHQSKFLSHYFFHTLGSNRPRHLRGVKVTTKKLVLIFPMVLLHLQFSSDVSFYSFFHNNNPFESKQDYIKLINR